MWLVVIPHLCVHRQPTKGPRGLIRFLRSAGTSIHKTIIFANRGKRDDVVFLRFNPSGIPQG